MPTYLNTCRHTSLIIKEIKRENRRERNRDSLREREKRGEERVRKERGERERKENNRQEKEREGERERNEKRGEGRKQQEKCSRIVIWDGALWFWSVIKTIMTDCSRFECTHHQKLTKSTVSFVLLRAIKTFLIYEHAWLYKHSCIHSCIQICHSRIIPTAHTHTHNIIMQTHVYTKAHIHLCVFSILQQIANNHPLFDATYQQHSITWLWCLVGRENLKFY